MSDIKRGGAYVRNVALSGFSEVLLRDGIDPTDLLEQVKFKPDVLTDVDGVMNWGRFCVLLELAAQHTGRAAFGLDMIQSVSDHFPNAVPLVLMAPTCPNMGAWLQASARYWRHYTSAYQGHLLIEPSGDCIIQLRFTRPGYPPRQVMEATLGGFCRLWRIVAGRDESPLLVRFQHLRPADTTCHEQIFNAPIEFGAAHSEIHLAAAQLTRPMSLTPMEPTDMVSWLVRQRIDSTPAYDQSIAHTVSMAIGCVLGAGICKVEFIAAALGVSTKKLQRLLAQEGTSFSTLLDGVRHGIAKKLLANPDIAVANVAGLLDYASTAPLTQAMHRWTGASPLAVRHMERSANLES